MAHIEIQLSNRSEDTSVSCALIEEICVAARAENQAIARRLVKIGELFELRREQHDEEKDWAVDTWAATGAEIAAALRCSVAMAGSYMHYARAMRDRLPQVAEVFVAGDIDFRTFQVISYRTDLIQEESAIAKVDRQLAASAPRWGSLSRSRLAAAIDRVVRRVDEDAVRRKRECVDNRGVIFWGGGEDGLTGMSATMLLADADVLDSRLDAMADSVCDGDPRTQDQRRSGALGALGAGHDRLSCQCGNDDCPVGGRLPSPAQVIIHIVAEQTTVDGGSDAPGYAVEKGELIPAELVAELAREARLRPLVHPADAPPEPGYVPSRKLTEFVRARDLTCRAPDCDRPAVECDIDHTVPHGDGGLTHASNLKCLCRFHHLLKTFWGWHDKQLRDGTVIWTLPGGQTYVTLPGSALIFPTLCAPTGEVPMPEPRVDDRCGDRSVMMPRRKTTRAQNRARYLTAERERNQKLSQARREAWRKVFDETYFGTPRPRDGDDDPPPF
ncbi:MAG TPA: HNH endonuclease signature motif containing protein [Mycobacterium sp.]|jgi:hypothetical protein